MPARSDAEFGAEPHSVVSPWRAPWPCCWPSRAPPPPARPAAQRERRSPGRLVTPAGAAVEGERVKLADEPLAPKKKSKSKVKLAAKAKKAKKREHRDRHFDDARLLGLALRPGLLAFPKKKKSNIHGVYDDDVSEFTGAAASSRPRAPACRRRSARRAAAAAEARARAVADRAMPVTRSILCATLMTAPPPCDGGGARPRRAPGGWSPPAKPGPLPPRPTHTPNRDGIHFAAQQSCPRLPSFAAQRGAARSPASAGATATPSRLSLLSRASSLAAAARGVGRGDAGNGAPGATTWRSKTMWCFPRLNSQPPASSASSMVRFLGSGAGSRSAVVPPSRRR